MTNGALTRSRPAVFLWHTKKWWVKMRQQLILSPRPFVDRCQTKLTLCNSLISRFTDNKLRLVNLYKHKTFKILKLGGHSCLYWLDRIFPAISFQPDPSLCGICDQEFVCFRTRPGGIAATHPAWWDWGCEPFPSTGRRYTVAHCTASRSTPSWNSKIINI